MWRIVKTKRLLIFFILPFLFATSIFTVITANLPATATAATSKPGCYDSTSKSSETCPTGYKSAVDQNNDPVLPTEYCYLVSLQTADNGPDNSTTSYAYYNVECSNLTTPYNPTGSSGLLIGDTNGDSFNYGAQDNELIICETSTGGTCNSNDITYFNEDSSNANSFSYSPGAGSPGEAATITISSANCGDATYIQSGYENSTITVGSVALLSTFGGNGPTCTMPANAATLYCADGTQPEADGECDDGSIPTTTKPSSSSTVLPPGGLCQSGGINLSWLLCPIINGVASLEQDIENTISGFLQTPILVFNSSDCNSAKQDCADAQSVYTTWGHFRVYADILLVIAVLAAVIMEALGGGVAEAYNVKKMLPRILIAAILINLSIYLVAGLEDITNVVGQGVFGIIKDSFNGANWPLQPNGFSSDIGFTSLFATGTVLAAIAWSGEFIAFFGLFVLLPALFALMAVFFTIILRQGILLMLLMVSPIAFALFCLPNTEQYFRKWWRFLIQILMVYPIMMALFAIGDVGYIVMNYIARSGGSTYSNLGGSSWITGLLPFIALIAPLFLMPFAFKMSGGVIGGLYSGLRTVGTKATESLKGNVNDPLSRRNSYRRAFNDRVLRRRERVVNRGVTMQRNNNSGFRKRLGGVIAGVSGGANYEIARSRMNKEALDIMHMQASTGGDNLIRGIFAKKLNYRDSNGEVKQGWFGTDARVGEDGMVVGQNSPKFSDYEVSKARGFYGKSASMYQAALDYEMGKVGDDQEYGELLKRDVENFNTWAKPIRQDAGSIQLGAGYAQQSARKEGKHLRLKVATKPGIDATGTSYAAGDMYYDIDHTAFARDMAENVGNYPLANMKTSTPAQMRDSYDWAQSVLSADGPGAADRDGVIVTANMRNQAEQTINDLRLSAQSIDTRYGGATTPVMGAAGEEGAPPPTEGLIPGSPAVGGRRITTGAPGRVDDEINTFVDHVLGPVQADGGRQFTPTSRATSSDIRERRQGLS